MSIQAGDQAPDFTLPKQDGTQVSLHDLLKRGSVVLYFYPKDHTLGCTMEACSFRDSYEVFKEAGAEVVGISSDSADSHQSFAEKHKLPFTLVADTDGAVRRLYGVRKFLGMVPGRVTFVIDRQGTVRHVFDSALRMTAHVDEALAVLKHVAVSQPTAP